VILQIRKFSGGLAGAVVGFGAARAEESSIENGDVDVESCGGVIEGDR
jgi:hypothetical protein